MKIDLYRDPKTNLWHWQVIARNGVVISHSPAGYQRRSHAERMARQVTNNVEPLPLTLTSAISTDDAEE